MYSAKDFSKGEFIIILKGEFAGFYGRIEKVCSDWIKVRVKSEPGSCGMVNLIPSHGEVEKLGPKPFEIKEEIIRITPY